MQRLIALGAFAFAVGTVLSVAKWEGDLDISWTLATSPWWLYGALLGVVYALVCLVVTVNLVTGK